MGRFDLSALGLDDLLNREWLATFGNGSFASSTICGMNTRKYHGLLVAAMAWPVRRMVLLSRVEETIHCNDVSYDLGCNEYPGTIHPHGHQYLRAFSHEPFPRWAYQCDGGTIEKQLRPLQGQNTVVISYTLLGGNRSVDLELRPLFALRGMHELMYQWNAHLDAQEVGPRQHQVPATSRSPEVFFSHDGIFLLQACWYLNTIYRREQERGYSGLEDLWLPGVIRWKLSPGQSAHFVCSSDPIDFGRALAESDCLFETTVPLVSAPAPDLAFSALLRAADQFVAHTREKRTAVITGYPWSAPSGRDMMICLPGLLLVSGRMDEARDLLVGFADMMKDGLMPSEMAEDGSGYAYTAADTSLWFIHGVGQYLRYHGDEDCVRRELMPVIDRIIDSYRGGTGLGIIADSEGLLASRVPGVPTTWMDAKIGEWVVTPRQGRPVCVNALWYNALRVAADLHGRFGQAARAEELLVLAQRARDAFNRRFWNESSGCCFDVVDDHGNDPSVRPNQILAISLPYAVLDSARQAAVLDKVRSVLLTPFGVRTLSPSEPAYQGTYGGPPVSRDRAYHQGCVFAWLLGPLVSAHIRVNGRGETVLVEARNMLHGCLEYLQDHGQLCELFDGNAPHRPGGATASARSVAEVLRCYAEDILGAFPQSRVVPRNDIVPSSALDRGPVSRPG